MIRFAARMLIVSAVVVTIALPAVADTVGSLDYFDGDVSVVRNGEIIARGLDFGYNLENLDQIRVGRAGVAEITTVPGTGMDATITVRAGSTLTLNMTSLRSDQTASVDLVRGSVGMRVNRLTGRSALQVRTATATMGVRGTVFDVITTVGDDVLVTTETGRVEVTPDGGPNLFAIPGQIVEKRADGVWRNIPVAVSSLAEFEATWVTDRVEAFRSQAGRAIVNYANRYLDLKNDFIDAYVELMSQRSVIQKWVREDREGRVGTLAEQMREKRAVIGPLMDIRGVLFLFERVYFRVIELREYYDAGGVRVGEIRRSLSAAQFFRIVDGDVDLFARRLNEVRYIMKLYALRNDGEMPLDAFSSDLGSGSMGGDDEDEDDFFSAPMPSRRSR